MEDFKDLRRNLPDTMAVRGLSWLSAFLRFDPDAFSKVLEPHPPDWLPPHSSVILTLWGSFVVFWVLKLIYITYMKIRLVSCSEESVLRLDNNSCWKLHREVIVVCCEDWTEEVEKVGVIPQRDMQTRRGRVGVTLLILNVGARGDLTPAAYPWQRAPVATLCRRLGRLQCRSGRMWKRQNFSSSSGFKARTLQPLASRYTNCAIPVPRIVKNTNTHIYTVDKIQAFIVNHDAILTIRLERVSIVLAFLTYWETMKVGRTLRYGKLI